MELHNSSWYNGKRCWVQLDFIPVRAKFRQVAINFTLNNQIQRHYSMLVYVQLKFPLSLYLYKCVTPLEIFKMRVWLIQKPVRILKTQKCPQKQLWLTLLQFCISILCTLWCFQRTVKQTLFILGTIFYVATHCS